MCKTFQYGDELFYALIVLLHAPVKFRALCEDSVHWTERSFQQLSSFVESFLCGLSSHDNFIQFFASLRPQYIEKHFQFLLSGNVIGINVVLKPLKMGSYVVRSVIKLYHSA